VGRVELYKSSVLIVGFANLMGIAAPYVAGVIISDGVSFNNI